MLRVFWLRVHGLLVCRVATAVMGGTKRKASGAAAATAAPDVDPLAVVPASLASVNSQHYTKVQMWLEEILGNAILKDLDQAMPLDIANGGHMVTPFCHLFP